VSSSERSSSPPARVLIVDDHPIVRHGLGQLITDVPDLYVCGSAASPTEALQAITESKPDLVLLDLSLGEDSGLELLKQIRTQHANLPVLVLSMHDEAYYADRVLRAGAMGYVMKQESADHVIAAIHQVLSGKVYLSETMSSSMLTRMVGGKSTDGGSPVDSLTDRELQVLNLIGRGLGTRQIAEQLHLSVKTVENYREHLTAKLKLQTSSELVRYAVRWDIEDGKST
jgi:DNA-binding NarL/FixJ family response regulator